jgi:hypothetical protein
VRVVNDGDRPIGVIEVESVDYEWGDLGNSEKIGTRVGPIEPGATVEIYRETDTEVRTSLTLKVDGRAHVIELGKLYAPKGRAPRTVAQFTPG